MAQATPLAKPNQINASLRRSSHSIALREPDPELQAIDLAAPAGHTRKGLTGTAGASAEGSQHSAGAALASAKPARQ